MKTSTEATPPLSVPPECARSFDPLSSAQRQCPYPLYAEARREAPIFFSERFNMWVVTRYEDVCSVLRDPATFSSRQSIYVRLEFSPRVQEVLRGGFPLVATLVNNDPPEHTRFRNLVSKAFLARRVALLEPRILAIARELVDGFAGDGQVDLVRRLAFPLPGRVIAEILGVPAGDMEQLKRWTDDWVIFIAGNLPEDRQVECARSIVAMQHYFAAKIEERRAAPQDDLITALLAATSEGDSPLTMNEIVCAVAQLQFAGHETTTSLIGSAVLLLLRSPALEAAVRRDPSRLGQLIEETLRLEAPIQGFFRSTTREVELGGVRLPKGARLQLSFGSANRDEARFGDAATLDLDRTDADKHLSFGRGIHFCIGASLARVQGRIALEVLLERLPKLRLSPHQNLTYVPSFQLRALERLQLEWDRSAP